MISLVFTQFMQEKYDSCMCLYIHTDGVHYHGSTRDAVIRPRSRFDCIPISIIDNSVYDVGGRVFYAELLSSDRAANITRSRVRINITDQDGMYDHKTSLKHASAQQILSPFLSPVPLFPLS